MPSDQSTTAPTQLLRRLGLVHAVLYGLGVTIGAGIYVLVGVAAGRSGMHAPLAFALAAIVMGLSAASFAELGTRMPVSASEAAYVERAFHRRWLSLATGLLVIITAVISASTISSGSAGYLQSFLPFDRVWIIAGVVIAMGLVSCLATIHSVTFAGLMTLIEVAGLVLIVGAGAWNGTGLLTRLPEIWPGGDLGGWLGVASTTMIAVFAFIGFEHLVNVAEEMKEPRRTLPAALFLTLGLTAVIYGLVVWVSITAVPPSELAASNAPLALVFERLTGWPPSSLSVIAIVATLNGVIVHMIMIARVIYGLAQQRNLPRVLGRVSRRTGTPLVATGIGVTLILFFSTALPLEGARRTHLARHAGSVCNREPGFDPHKVAGVYPAPGGLHLSHVDTLCRPCGQSPALGVRQSSFVLMSIKSGMGPDDTVHLVNLQEDHMRRTCDA